MLSTINEVLSRQFANVLSERLGIHIAAEHVHTDAEGWLYYIPAYGLQTSRPLVLRHYRGPLFVVIPAYDWGQLKRGASVQKYIDLAVWNYGYFWGGGSVLDGVYWQPLEDVSGINDADTIWRYLTILGCRTGLRSHGYYPEEDYCAACAVGGCPLYARLDRRLWSGETQELDDRRLLYRALSRDLFCRFGLRVERCCVHASDTVVMRPLWNEDSVELTFSNELFVDMLYHPGYYNIDALAKELLLIAEPHWLFSQESLARIPVTEHTTREDLLGFWRAHGCTSIWVSDMCDEIAGETDNSSYTPRRAAPTRTRLFSRASCRGKAGTGLWSRLFSR